MTAQPQETWSPLFKEPVSTDFRDFHECLDQDRRIALYDVAGSQVHAAMLTRAGILSAADNAAIQEGLARIADEMRDGTFPWNKAYEDVHLNIEQRLTALVGDAGKRLHTARSRNDQVATDIRLWLRAEIDALSNAAERPARGAAWTWPREHAGHDHAGLHPPAGGAAGHLRPPPDGVRRDVRARRASACADCRSASTACRSAPRRSPARGYPIDRERVASDAGLRRRLPQLARRGVGSRLRHRILAAARADHGAPVALLRGAGAVVSPRFGFIALADRFCTGSSIMPQKKNPDVPELVRGKTGRVIGHLTVLAGAR